MDRATRFSTVEADAPPAERHHIVRHRRRPGSKATVTAGGRAVTAEAVHGAIRAEVPGADVVQFTLAVQ
eukprot:513989-Alexandrium_andersonii.AAC.1